MRGPPHATYLSGPVPSKGIRAGQAGALGCIGACFTKTIVRQLLRQLSLLPKAINGLTWDRWTGARLSGPCPTMYGAVPVDITLLRDAAAAAACALAISAVVAVAAGDALCVGQEHHPQRGIHVEVRASAPAECIHARQAPHAPMRLRPVSCPACQQADQQAMEAWRGCRPGRPDGSPSMLTDSNVQ
jgi:hypothetical protein